MHVGEAAYVQVSGPHAQDAFTETEEGLTARRPPDTLNMPRETTGARPRRAPPLVECGDRAVGAEKSRYQQHVESYNPERTRRAKLAARAAWDVVGVR